MTQHDEKNPQYSREFFRDMPVSDEEKGKSQLDNFRWSRVFKGFFLLPLFSALFAAFVGSILVASFEAFLIAILLFAFFAYLFLGLQSLVWAFILECLYNKPKARKIWGVLGLLFIAVSFYFFDNKGEVSSKFFGSSYAISIFIFLAGIITLYLLRKKNDTSPLEETVSGSLKK